MKQNPTVFVVDDGPAMRESLRWLVEAVGLSVETYASPEEFLERFDASKPGCLLLDVKMPSMNGLEVQQELAARGALTPIIFLTAYGDVPVAVRACQAGAFDFIEKPFSDDVVLTAIRKALAKDRLLRHRRKEEVEFAERTAILTPRERDVMTRVMAGKTNNDMALELGVSPRTIEVHRGHLMTKLGADSVADLVRLGLSTRAVLARRHPSPIPRAPRPIPSGKRLKHQRLRRQKKTGER
jgi:two-component system response regulator FixJ